MINTKCAHCQFRKNDENGQQNGCELNRLEKFISRNEAEPENDYYTISRFCSTCRSEGYTKESVLKEIEVSCCFIVYGWNDYWITLKSILKQTVKPRVVYVVFDDMRLFSMDKYKQYQELYNNQNITLIFKRYFENKPFFRMIDDIVRRCNTQYYCTIKHQIDSNFLEKYNKIINIDLVPLVAHFKKNHFNSFISCALHNKFNGNYNLPIAKKIKQYLEGLDENDRKLQERGVIFD